MYAGACFLVLSPTKIMSEIQKWFFFCPAIMPDKNNVDFSERYLLSFCHYVRQK